MLNYLGLMLLISSLVSVPGGRCSKLGRADDLKTTEANEYMDDVIRKTIEEYRDQLEPYRPEDMTFTFEEKILFVTFKREITLTNIAITGLTTIHREGDCERKNNVLSCNLVMGVVEMESKATAKFMKVGPTFDLEGTIGYLMIHIEVTRDKDAGTPPKVKKLEIHEQKGTEIKVSGMGILNKFAEVIIKAAEKLFRGKIRKAIEDKMVESLDEKFQESIFPID